MFDEIVLGLSGFNIVMVIALIAVYANNFRLVRSKMTFGMLIFASMFLLENIFSLYFYSSLLAQGITSITTFNLVVKFLEMLGLLTLLYVTWK
ncbi:MAG: hypothetical protein J7K54_02975 [Candidatus Aenigmarchaeota archaeon]|nr:hypothetical protein [Candidatus Aenigmarchaeota archaeon]